MIKELHTAALAMMNNQTRLEVTANNIANVNTIGFKRTGVFERNLLDAKASLFSIPMKIEQNDPPIGSYLDWSAGAYTHTGNPLDVAIEGKGFFVCRNVDGIISLTRNGSFMLNSEGFVTTFDGKYVLASDGDVIQIPDYAVINDEANKNDRIAVDIAISKSGEITANDVSIARLRIVDVEDYAKIQRISKQDFIPTEDYGVVIIPETMITVKQQWLENSNVDIISEMVTMIELQRAFETGSKVIQTNDNTLEKSIGTAKYGMY